MIITARYAEITFFLWTAVISGQFILMYLLKKTDVLNVKSILIKIQDIAVTAELPLDYLVF
jgi:hypothetical protein